MQVRNPLRTVGQLGLAVTAGLFGAAPALAQSGTTTTQVIELNYAPAAPLMGLDLRAGRYLLDLRGPLAGPYQGVLYGPNNEVVDDRLSISGSGCAAGVPASGQLSTLTRAARPSINPLGLGVSSSGGCQLSGNAHAIGLVATTDIPDPIPNTCNPPDEPQVEKSVAVGATDGPPVCNEGDPTISFKADLRPGPTVWIAGTPRPWGGATVLPSTAAVARTDGRCHFNYTYRVDNIGVAPSGATSNALNLNQPFNLQLDQRGVPGLLPGASAIVSGQFALPPGKWRLRLHLDSIYAVDELDGNNNFAVLRVEVRGRCDAPAP